MDDGGDAIRAVSDLSYRRLVNQMVAWSTNRAKTEDVQESPLRSLTHRRRLSQLSLPVRVTAAPHGDRSVVQRDHEVSAPEGTVKARLARACARMAGHLSDPEEADHV
jgi:hypothetical protein